MQQTPTQIREHVREFVALANFSMRVDKLGNLLERVEILNDLFADGGALHLYYYGASISHGCSMQLRQRRGRRRFSFELKKEFRKPAAQFRRNDALDFFVRKRLNPVLQTRQRIEVRLRQQIAAGGKKLPKFDERRPKLLKIVSKLIRFWLRHQSG